jgi:hypothetical protein
MLPTIAIEDLDEHAAAELVRVEFPLITIPAEELQPQVKPLLNKFGEIIVISGTNTLIIEDTVRNLRTISLVIQELEACGGFLVDRKSSTSHTCTLPAISAATVF